MKEVVELINREKYDEAIKKLNSAKELPELEAYSGLGYACLLQKDYNKAEKYYHIAAENGDADAMNNLGFIYSEIKNDYSAAEKYYVMASDKGNADAMNNLGLLYYKIKHDYENAEKQFLLAVKQKSIDAIYNLGILYDTIKKDYSRAEKYYLLSAEKGEAKAMNNLAVLYLETRDNSKKEAALKAISGIKYIESDPLYLATKTEVSLWNEQFKEACSLLQTLLNNYLKDEDSSGIISRTLTCFLVFKQKQFLYRPFTGGDKTLTDRFKPVYFALLSEMKEELPNEYLRVPEELDEPVSDLLNLIKKERGRLAI